MQQDLNNRFTYHAPTETKKHVHETVRALCLQLALNLDNHLIEGREKSLAITHLEYVMFWANASIARS